MGELESFLKGRRVVLVGPSPKIIGKALGSAIDQYDVVIRIKKGFPVPLEMIQDYGKNTHVIMTNLRTDNHTNQLDPHTLATFRQQGGMTLCVPYPLRSVEDRFRLSKEDRLAVSHWTKFDPRGIPVSYPINFAEWTQIQNQIGSKPTIGALAIYAILKCYVKELWILGMTFRVDFEMKDSNCNSPYHSSYLSPYLSWYKTPDQIRHSRMTIATGIHNVSREQRYLKKLIHRHPETKLEEETRLALIKSI